MLFITSDHNMSCFLQVTFPSSKENCFSHRNGPQMGVDTLVLLIAGSLLIFRIPYRNNMVLSNQMRKFNVAANMLCDCSSGYRNILHCYVNSQGSYGRFVRWRWLKEINRSNTTLRMLRNWAVFGFRIFGVEGVQYRCFRILKPKTANLYDWNRNKITFLH